MRLIRVLDAGPPAPLVNQDVFDQEGRLLGVVDLLDPVAGVVGEYDGADHRTARRHTRDVARLPVELRRWTLEPPPHRPRAETLDELLDRRAGLGP